MLRGMLKSKIHRAIVTNAFLEYEGSLTVDQDLMDAVGLIPNELISVCNINNGERLETYVIPGVRGNGDICLNGAAARKGMVGDRIIILSYCYVSDEEIRNGFKPSIISLSEDNKLYKTL
ncbi:MAG: aspartate 1-decarboxylase [Nitrospirae bacterium]|nr:aspartate 1-decarboxylase [Nitrospirota bacterium]MBF0542596.1 aspartate 1-decarboxylase [Nitrospirota bacterium]